MKKDIGVTHFIGECQDCEWHNESYRNGQALAAKHAKKYGHLVHYEVGLTGNYDGRRAIAKISDDSAPNS